MSFCYLSLKHDKTLQIQFDDNDGGGDEEHPAGGGVKPGEKSGEERPG